MPDGGPISCDLHDHLELACLRGYDLTLTLLDGSCVTGTAVTTRTGAEKVEYLCLSSNGQALEIPLRHLAHLVVTTPQAMFRELHFAAPGEGD